MKDLLALFKNPQSRYRSAPFWSLNDELDAEELRRQIRQFHRVGMGGYFMHARPGLMTPYMEEPWMAAIGACIDEGRRLGMEAWLYDEDKWPSGFAGGKVLEQNPDLVQIMLHWFFLHKDEAEPADAVAVFPLDDDQRPEDSDIDRIGFREVTAEARGWFNGRPYVDLRDPRWFDAWHKTTLQPYAQRFGEDFAISIPGIFTDEPHGVPSLQDCLPWTRDFLHIFQDEMGYDLKPELPALLFRTGSWRRVRFDFWTLINTLFIDNFAGPYFDWCDEQGLELTGHYWEHSFPGPFAEFAPMPLYLYMQRPGIDCLFNQFHPSPANAASRQFGKTRIVKEAAAIAAQTGRRHVLCEAYGGSGWELDFRDMKRNGDWLFVLGINDMCQHLSHYSLRGYRKLDFPLSFLDHQPWWPHYRKLNDYFARLSVILTHGTTTHRIGVLHPASSASMLYEPRGDSPEATAIDAAFEQLTRALLGMHFGFDYVDETVLAEIGRVQEGTLAVGRQRYDTLIIPNKTANLTVHTYHLLREFIGSGGHVIRFEEEPAYVDGELSEDLIELLSFPEVIYCEDEADAIEYALETTARREVSVSADGREIADIYCQVREFKNRTFYFMANVSGEETYTAHLVLRNGYDIELWDPLDGSVTVLQSKDRWGGCATDLLFHPAQSWLLAVTHERSNAPLAEPTLQRVVESIPMQNIQVRREDPNVLVLDRCQFQLESIDLRQGPVNIHEANAAVFKHHGLEVANQAAQPWTWATGDRALPADTGFSLLFEFDLAADWKPTELFLVVESGRHYNLHVNEQRVKPDNGWWLDRSFDRFPILSAIRGGRNRVTLHCSPMRKDVEPAACYLIGDFSVGAYSFISEPTMPAWYQRYQQVILRMDDVPLIGPNEDLEVGDWLRQGLPFYSGSVLYSGTISLDRPNGRRRARLVLDDWIGVVAQVTVNGNDAGIIGWPPPHLDVSEYVIPGDNHVELRLVSSLRNTLGPLHWRSVDGFVHPAALGFGSDDRYLPEQEYSLQKHGLMRAPVIELLEP